MAGSKRARLLRFFYYKVHGSVTELFAAEAVDIRRLSKSKGRQDSFVVKKSISLGGH